MQDFRNLDVWHKAHELSLDVLCARDLGYFGNSDFERLTANTVEVRKMLFGLRKAIRRAIREGTSIPFQSPSRPPGTTSVPLEPSTTI